MIFSFIVLIGFWECNSIMGRNIKRKKYGNVSPGVGMISSNSIILTEQKKTIHMYIFTWNIGPRSSLGRLEPLDICVMRGDHNTSEMFGANQNSALLYPMRLTWLCTWLRVNISGPARGQGRWCRGSRRGGSRPCCLQPED